MLEDELLLVLIHLGGQGGVVVLNAKVVLYQVEGLLVDLLVFVALEKLYFIQAWRRKSRLHPRVLYAFNKRKLSTITFVINTYSCRKRRGEGGWRQRNRSILVTYTLMTGVHRVWVQDWASRAWKW